MRERWRVIEGFPGYEVSSEGQVRSYKNYRGEITQRAHVLKPRINHNGYAIVVLYNEEHKPHQLSVHRLVAKAFIPTHDDNLFIDHLDNDKLNNSVYNLEWVTSRENSIRAYHDGLYEPAFMATRRPVIVTDLRTNEERFFKSLNEAARELKYSSAILSRVANGLAEKFGHYTVEFIEGEDVLLYGDYI